MKNATRTFMEAKDLVSLSKARERLLPCGRCGCFRWFSNYNAERIATDWRRQRYGHWHEQPGRKRTSRIQGKHPRDSRLPTPAKSRLTSTGAAKGGPAHGTRAHLQPGQCLLCRQMGHMALDCPNRGMRDDSGINLKRAFGSFVGPKTGTKNVWRCASRPCGSCPPGGPRQWLRLSWPPVLLQRLDVALVAPGTVQTNVINSVTAAGGTAEEWSDGDLTTVRGAEKLREWIMTKSPRLVWFCCPAENSTPSESSRSTAVQSRPRHQSREHRIQRHMSNLAADMASSGQV